ncbi:MAG TPA: FAD-dependent oxidoreductase [Armatimonadota bacterium]|jgi:ribulose 1,5-bisphosphate synthetase/thiazole synthase
MSEHSYAYSVIDRHTHTLQPSESSLFDVVVVGGGIAGVMAAIAAAREGKATLLLERYLALGGMATLGLVQPITIWGGARNAYVIAGTGKRLLEDMAARDPHAATAMTPYGPTCDAEYLKMMLEQQAMAAGVTLLYDMRVHGVEKDGDRITGLRAITKDGDIALRGKVFIDATGDADVAAFAGVPCDEDRQGITLMFIMAGIDRSRCPDGTVIQDTWVKHRVMGYRGSVLFWHPRPDAAYVNMTEIDGRNGLRATDLTYCTVECRKQAWEILEVYRKYIPGFEHAYIEQTAPALGVRETRRIRGIHRLVAAEVLENTPFPDVIARAACPLDIHGSDGQSRYTRLERSYGIPYRSLITNEIANLIVTGRCISADHTAHSSLRRMAPGFALGEAAGIAAACATSLGHVREVPITSLQARILHYGGMLESEENTGIPF